MLESDSLVNLPSAGIKRHETGTVDPPISAPTHQEGVYGDFMKMLLLVSCVMSHFERELFFEQMKYWKMLDHLQADVILRIHYCRGTQMDLPDGIVPHVPKNVRRSVFNDIPPIQD